MRIAFALTCLVTAFAASWGAAATLGVAGAPMAAGAATVAECDTDGFTFEPRTTGGDVTSLKIDGIDDGCEGMTVRAQIVLGGTGVGTAVAEAVPVDGDTLPASVTLSVSSGPAALGLDGVRVAIAP